MGMTVDNAGHQREAIGIQRLSRCHSKRLAHTDDHTCPDRHITYGGFLTATIVDNGFLNQQINIHHGYPAKREKNITLPDEACPLKNCAAHGPSA
jgi:hypothetical protein